MGDAAFDPNKTSPEEELDTAGQGNAVSAGCSSCSLIEGAGVLRGWSCFCFLSIGVRGVCGVWGAGLPGKFVLCGLMFIVIGQLLGRARG